MKSVILFRGRHTAQILADVQKVHPDAEWFVVAGAGDRLMQPGDITPVAAVRMVRSAAEGDEIVIVANGGPSGPAFRLVASAVREYVTRSIVWDEYADCRGRFHDYAGTERPFALRVIDAQRDGVTQIFP